MSVALSSAFSCFWCPTLFYTFFIWFPFGPLNLNEPVVSAGPRAILTFLAIIHYSIPNIISLPSMITAVWQRRNNATSKPRKVSTRNLISQRSPNSSLPEKPLSSNFAYEQPSDAQALNGMLCLLWWVGQPIHLPECAQSRGVGNRCSRHRAPAGDGLGLHHPPPVRYQPSGTIWTSAPSATWRASWGSMRGGGLSAAAWRTLCLSHSCRIQIRCSTGDGAGPPVCVPQNRVRASKPLPACAVANAVLSSMTECHAIMWSSAKEKKTYWHTDLLNILKAGS